METACKLEGQTRDSLGTGSARALRRESKVPSVLYANGQEPVHFSVPHKDIVREYYRGGFYGKVVTLVIDGKEVFGVPRDVQVHPLNDKIIHVDFQKVEKGAEVRVLVPVRFINNDKCIGIRRGGSLNVVRFDLELICPVNAIPEQIIIDVKDLNIGDSVHISHVELPEGVRPTIDRDFTIAAVAGRVSRAAKDAEAAEAE